jgi:hypothetical protein
MILETRRARFFVLCLALCSTAAAPALAETLIADQNGCKAVNPHPQPNQSITWSGGCKDGLLFGPGVLQLLQDGLLDASYQGDFWHGQLSGHGVATLRDGSRYDGNFTSSVFAGEGSMTWRNGDRYQGHWSAGKRNGHGELQQSAGAHYEGDFYNNLYDGHGVMHFADHSIYEGGWSAGKRAGQGKQTNPDGTSFVATFQNDRPVGQVLLQTPDGIQRHLLVAEGQLADANQTGSKRCLEKSGHQLIYPPAASNNNIFSGQSRVHFDLDQDGQLTHIRSIESTNAIFDEAALAFVTELNCQSGLAEKTTWTLNFKTAGDEAHPVPEIGPPADITDGRRVLLLRVLESDLPHVNSQFDHFARNVGEGFAMRVSAMLRSRGISVAHLLDLDLNRAVADKIRDGARLEKARFVIVPRIDKPSGEFAGSVKVTVDFYQLPENVPAGDADPLFSKSYSVAIPLRGERPVGIAEMAQDVVDSLEKDGRLSVLEARCDAHLCAQPEAAK